MRHGVAGRKLGRNSSSRRALSTAQATALLRHGRIETTLAKAKELQPYVERLITTAKKAPATTPQAIPSRVDPNSSTPKRDF